MTNLKLECVACGWLGKPDDRQRKPSQDPGFEGMTDMVCPHCSGMDFYKVKVSAEKEGDGNE